MKKIVIFLSLFIALASSVSKRISESFDVKSITSPLSYILKTPIVIETPVDAKKVATLVNHNNLSNYQMSHFLPKIKENKLARKNDQKDDFKTNLVVKKKRVEQYKLEDFAKSAPLKTIRTTKKIVKNILELDLKEKVETSGYKEISLISKSKWSIFEYSMDLTIIEEKQIPKIEIAKTNSQTYSIPDLAQKTDRISTALAATEKSNVTESLNEEEINIDVAQMVVENQNASNHKEAVNPQILEDDIVFFDYSSANDELQKNNNQAKLATLQKTNEKALPKAEFEIAPIEPKQTKKSGPIGPVNTVVDDKNDQVKMNQTSDNIEYSIRPYGVEVTKVKKMVSHFEVRFDDDIDEIVQSYGEGVVKFSNKVNNHYGVRRSTIYASGYLPTATDIIMESQKEAAKVPLLTSNYLKQIIENNKITGLGATALVELDATTEDVEIDSRYEKKVYLNQNFNVVDRSESDFSFIIFVGVDAGNTIINFKTIENRTLSKIIHLKSEEVYYEPNFYINIERDNFSLYEEYLLTKDQNHLSLDPDLLKGLTYSNKFKKITNNKYEVKNVTYPLGMRSYIELKHREESIYVGRWGNEKVLVPSEEYIRYVLDQFKLNKVSSNCLVQINLPKSAREISFNGQSQNGNMRMQVKILDNDGIFYSDLSKDSQKIFLLGEEQGIVSIKVNYYDGTEDYLLSYCSDSTYLVEQL